MPAVGQKVRKGGREQWIGAQHRVGEELAATTQHMPMCTHIVCSCINDNNFCFYSDLALQGRHEYQACLHTQNHNICSSRAISNSTSYISRDMPRDVPPPAAQHRLVDHFHAAAATCIINANLSHALLPAWCARWSWGAWG